MHTSSRKTNPLISGCIDPSGFYRAIPDVLNVLRKYSRKVFAGECRIEEMIFTARISHNLQDYRQANNNTAAMRQFQKEGITIQPGQSIRYVITDSAL